MPRAAFGGGARRALPRQGCGRHLVAVAGVLPHQRHRLGGGRLHAGLVRVRVARQQGGACLQFPLLAQRLRVRSVHLDEVVGPQGQLLLLQRPRRVGVERLGADDLGLVDHRHLARALGLEVHGIDAVAHVEPRRVARAEHNARLRFAALHVLDRGHPRLPARGDGQPACLLHLLRAHEHLGVRVGDDRGRLLGVVALHRRQVLARVDHGEPEAAGLGGHQRHAVHGVVAHLVEDDDERRGRGGGAVLHHVLPAALQLRAERGTHHPLEVGRDDLAQVGDLVPRLLQRGQHDHEDAAVEHHVVHVDLPVGGPEDVAVHVGQGAEDLRELHLQVPVLVQRGLRLVGPLAILVARQRVQVGLHAGPDGRGHVRPLRGVGQFDDALEQHRVADRADVQLALALVAQPHQGLHEAREHGHGAALPHRPFAARLGHQADDHLGQPVRRARAERVQRVGADPLAFSAVLVAVHEIQDEQVVLPSPPAAQRVHLGEQRHVSLAVAVEQA